MTCIKLFNNSIEGNEKNKQEYVTKNYFDWKIYEVNWGEMKNVYLNELIEVKMQ